MAKAKKATSSAPKKTSKKSGAPAQPAGTPLIDTSLAAQQAAQLLAAKVEAPPAAAAAPKPESSLFKKLKEGLNKPHLSGGSILGTNAANRKPGPLSGFTKQVGHNQTFGADINRAGVPRRTGG
jgi:hypothetical protein